MPVKFQKGTTSKAREMAKEWININLRTYADKLKLGLPEYDDRLDCWRVPIRASRTSTESIGELRFSRDLEEEIGNTEVKLMVERIKQFDSNDAKPISASSKSNIFIPAPVPNKVLYGDCIKVLDEFPADTAQLIFTSPPYYNAKPEYSEYIDYQEYLNFLRSVIVRCHAVLSEGRFFVINVSPVLIKRSSRNTSSKRIAIPFDINKVFEEVGFEFVDDIIWVKPEGAGWNLGRGRRFAADRQPLQYKPVPVTEYILVYRKKTNRLIDWNIRNHYNQDLVAESKITGEYDRTNIWHIHPSSSRVHPAIFPEELVEKVIRYYSFIDDLVLDPFAGSGTVGKVAYAMKRRFLLIEKERKYYEHMKSALQKSIPDSVRVDYEYYPDSLEDDHEN